MRIQIESTTKTVTFNGVECRIWEGHTASGIPVHCYIPRIAVDRELDAAEFEADLKAQRAPSVEIDEIPLRMIL